MGCTDEISCERVLVCARPQYLTRHEKVTVRAKHSAVEVDKLQETMEHRRTSCNANRRQTERRQSQVARARDGASGLHTGMECATESATEPEGV